MAEPLIRVELVMPGGGRSRAPSSTQASDAHVKAWAENEKASSEALREAEKQAKKESRERLQQYRLIERRRRDVELWQKQRLKEQNEAVARSAQRLTTAATTARNVASLNTGGLSSAARTAATTAATGAVGLSGIALAQGSVLAAGTLAAIFGTSRALSGSGFAQFGATLGIDAGFSESVRQFFAQLGNEFDAHGRAEQHARKMSGAEAFLGGDADYDRYTRRTSEFWQLYKEDLLIGQRIEADLARDVGSANLRALGESELSKQSAKALNNLGDAAGALAKRIAGMFGN